jgi:hypothetical protein
MAEMNGLYVNSHFHVQVIFMNYEENAWYLYGHETEENVGGEDMNELIVEEETRNVTIVDKNGDLKHGTYDERCILWEDSEKWTKIDISSAQWRLLTRRTYIPMTFILLSIMQSLCKYMYGKCLSTILLLKAKVKKL